MSTHTPGPWRLRIGDGENGADGVGYIDGPHPGGYSWAKEVAVLYGMDGETYDAHLIAAAPELLQALKACEALITDAKCIGSFTWSQVRTQARAAIAKAEGVQ